MRNRATEGKLQSGSRKEVPGTKSDLMSQLIRPLIPFPALAGLQPSSSNFCGRRRLGWWRGRNLEMGRLHGWLDTQAMGILGQIRELRRREKKETMTVRGNVIPSNSINGDRDSAGEGGWRNWELNASAKLSFISAWERETCQTLSSLF